MKRVAWFILFLAMGVSCLDKPDCYRQNLDLIGISFKKLLDGKADTVILYTGIDTIGPTSITVSLDYLNKDKKIELKLFGPLTNDVFTLGFDSRPQFVSAECGERFIVSNLRILDQTLSNHDSIRVASDLPSNPAGTNIVIYRCPRTNIMRLGFRQLYMDNDSLGKDDLRIVKTIAIDSDVPKKYSSTPKYTLAPTKSVLLPLNPSKKTIEYHFQFDNEKKNVSFNYEMRQDTIIKKCGPQYVFGRLAKVQTDFPILKVVNDSIYDPPYTNIISYRCPTTNQITVLFRKKKGDSTPAYVTITSITADYTIDLSTYVSKGAVSSLTLPLNPASSVTSTKFTFVVKRETETETKALIVDYGIEYKEFHKECGSQPVYTTLSIDQQSNDFSSQTILDANVKFPAVNNVEIIP